MAKIAYATKVSNNGETVNGKFFSADANEIKSSVNFLYDEIEIINDNMAILDRTPIPVTVQGGLTIIWQTDLVPSDPLTRTYLARFGNVINGMTGLETLANGTQTGYVPEFIITKALGFITTVQIQLLQIGSFQIL